MAIQSNKLKDALDKSIDAEFEAILDSAAGEQYFTAEFDDSMRRLFHEDAKKAEVRYRTKVLSIIIAAAIFAVALTIACSVPEIRESIAGFFIRAFSDHVEYSNPSVKVTIEEEYGLVPIPEGFIMVKTQDISVSHSITYQRGTNEFILLVQSAKGEGGGNVDCENGTFIEKEVGGKVVRLYYSDANAQATWAEGGYMFSLCYTSHVESDVFEAWIDSVKILN